MTNNLSNKRIILVLISCLSVFYLKAQIFAPDFSCIRNDTLFWTPAQNSCGAFQAYRIYYATDVNGPYNQLVEITDPAELSFFHINPTDETRFYYLETVANCVGENTNQSDTLDNLSPRQFSIASVSVQTDTVHINWEPSSSPEVNAYIIYRRTNLGTIPIDTVFQMTSYIDLQASPGQQSEEYFIIALDPCGNTSVFDLPHNSIFLKTQIEDCDPNIYLNWNLYKNWEDGIEKQEVWVSEGGNPPSLIEELAPNDTLYTFSDTKDGETYRFFIRAIAQQSSYIAQSNIAERQLDIKQPVNELIITHISLNLDQSVYIEWYWNKEADVKEVLLQESRGDTTFESIVDVSVPQTNENSWVTDPQIALSTMTFFNLRTIDDCNREVISNKVSPIILSGEALRNNTNSLEWTPYQLPNSEILNYQISRVSNGQKELIATVDADTNSYIDIIDGRNDEEQLICYVIDAEILVQLPNGNELIKKSQSNQVCVQQFFTLLLPNAFAPDGRNNVFRPAIIFGNNIDFEMSIYNRWGERVFFTKDISKGWNGRSDGIAFPASVYVYIIKVKQPDGKEEMYKGFVTLVK